MFPSQCSSPVHLKRWHAHKEKLFASTAALAENRAVPGNNGEKNKLTNTHLEIFCIKNRGLSSLPSSEEPVWMTDGRRI